MQNMFAVAGRGACPVSYTPVMLLTDGGIALESVKSLTPDIVLLDSSMNGDRALRVTRSLKGDARTAAIPILLVGTSLEVNATDATHLPYADSRLGNNSP